MFPPMGAAPDHPLADHLTPLCGGGFDSFPLRFQWLGDQAASRAARFQHLRPLGGGGVATFWRVTFLLALPGIYAAFLVVFIESISDFGNPLVLAGAAFPMLAPQAYLKITGSFNLPRGAMLAVVLLIPSLIAFAVQRYWVSKRQVVTVTGKPIASTSKIVSPFAKWSLYVIVLAFAGLVLAFVRAMTAISATIFLVSANWNLMTVQILNQVGSGRLGVAAAFSIVILFVFRRADPR